MSFVISHLAMPGKVCLWPKRLLTLGTVALLAFQAGPLPLRESWRPPQPVSLTATSDRAVSDLSTSLPKGPLISSSPIQLERTASQAGDGKLAAASVQAGLPSPFRPLFPTSLQRRHHAAGLPITLWDRGPPPVMAG